MTGAGPNRDAPLDPHERETRSRWLSDETLSHLRRIADWPDLTGTRYEVIEPLARGGMGTIYLAEDRSLGRQVALKVLHNVHVPTDIADRMLREARIIAGLEHPGIVPVHEVGVLHDGRIYYVMKLVKGRRLDGLVQSAASLSDLLRVFEKICDSVAFAHAYGVIHRDLKPENIMVGSFGEVLVMDWGLAKLRRDGSSTISPAPAALSPSPSGSEAATTAHGTVLGTPAYMAPEQVQGRIDLIDERTDVYALGGILHFMLNGAAPPEDGAAADASMTMTSHAHHPIPRPLQAICRKALAAEREHRYASVTEMGADVSRFLDGLSVEAYREGILEKAGRVFTKYRTPIVLVLAYLFMRAVLVFFAGS